MREVEDIFRLCRAYSNSVKVPAFVIDDKGRLIGPSQAGARPNFCRLIQEQYQREEDCRRAHLYGSYQSERFGEAYIFFCPYGLVHWAAPVVNEYQIPYSLVAGPVLMSSPENTLIEDILLKNGFTEKDIPVLYRELPEIRYAPPNMVNDMASLLFVTASYLSDSSGRTLTDKQAFFNQQSSLSEELQSIKRGERKQESYPLEKEKELVAKIKLGDKKGAQKLLNEIFGYIFFSQGNDLDSIKTRVVELVVLLSRAALEGGADNGVIFGLNYKYLREVNDLKTVDEIAFWLSKVMARFTDCVFNLANVKNIDIIYKAVAYLRENYMNEISLEKVAKAVNLSPSYFSKVFKEEMRCNYRSYLNALRVEISKKLLLDESIPLIEVAGLVGFQDQSYYSKIFKKLVNITPGEYRRTRGLIDKKAI